MNISLFVNMRAYAACKMRAKFMNINRCEYMYDEFDDDLVSG